MPLGANHVYCYHTAKLRTNSRRGRPYVASSEETGAVAPTVRSAKSSTRAIKDSFVKLNPLTLAKNPVMFVVEVGAVLTTVFLIRDMFTGAGGSDFESRSRSGSGSRSSSRTSPKPWPKRAARRKPTACAKRRPMSWPNGSPHGQDRRGSCFAAALGRHGVLRRGRTNPRRRRSDRRYRHRRRVGYHRRKRAGHSRIGWRPQRRHRRNEAYCRITSRSESPPTPAKRSWTV